MSIQAISTKVISTLGNKDSLIPIIVKDGVDSASLTYKSYKEGGAVEGFDRGIDEFGTQAIWVGGIPFYKKLIDKLVYKKAKISPDVDVRVLMNNEYANWAKSNAKGVMPNTNSQTVKSAVYKALEDGGKKAQSLYKTKIIAATALTLGTYFLLTKFKQKNTKNSVLKEMNTNVNDSFMKSNLPKAENSVFSDVISFSSLNSAKNKSSKQSFKGLNLKTVSDAVLFNPVHNMKIIDAGITAERLGCSRNFVELGEHSIKEFSFLFFLYGFGNQLEKAINKGANKLLNRPIDLPIDVLMDKGFKKALETGKIATDMSKLPEASKSLTDKLNFIVQNPDNSVVQAAKKSGIVGTVKDKLGNSFVNVAKFIDTKDVYDLADNMKNINDKFLASNISVDKFLNQTKALKVASVVANIGVSCLFLGYVIPKAVYKYREFKTGSTSFHVANDIKNSSKKV